MPGILPMKVIKVGNNSQSRIAQACDRCRSKKIRCDGIRPCCSQCANVGFECKTSDKLSRRAFPRGYTESLEERVRALEAEVRELKELLDEKDEKIDMLSKMHSNRRASIENSIASNLTPPSWDNRKSLNTSPTKNMKKSVSPVLQAPDSFEFSFVGKSNGSAFADMLQRKIQDSDRSCGDMTIKALFDPPKSTGNILPFQASWSAPPRMFSDRAINIFLQEWAPLFPVLHRPTLLKQYGEFVTKPEDVSDKQKLAQLYLVFSIAGLSSSLPDKEHLQSCEQEWQKAIEAVSTDNTLATLQTLILAIIYCISKADYRKLLYHMSNAVALSYRLGLHKTQKRDEHISLSSETKKKVFWTLYTLDCFTAAMLGVPKLLKEADIRCEQPEDIDEEALKEKGYKKRPSAAESKMSAALALFEVARILAKVLEEVYPATASTPLSWRRLQNLEKRLNDWNHDLEPQHKLTFAHDKPSTNLTGSRSAFLSLAYYYVRNLIHRPSLSSSSEHNASSAIISIVESSKRTVQIIQLLKERNMSFSFCLNRMDLLTLCGLSLLYQNLDLTIGSSMLKDGNRLLSVIQTYLAEEDALRASKFEKLVNVSMPVSTNAEPGCSPDGSMLVSSSGKPSHKPTIQRIQSAPLAIPVAKNSDALRAHQDKHRRATYPSNTGVESSVQDQADYSEGSVSPPSKSFLMPRLVHRTASSSQLPTPSDIRRNLSRVVPRKNLDYLSLSNTPQCSRPTSPVATGASLKHHVPIFPGAVTIPTPAQAQKASSVSAAEWQTLLSSLDGGQKTAFEAVYDDSTIPVTTLPCKRTNQLDFSTSVFPNFYHPDALSPQTAYGGVWGPSLEQWNYDGLSMHEFTKQELSMNLSQSVLSFSEESLSSGDERGGDVSGSLGSDVGAVDSPSSMFKSEYGADLMVGGSSRGSFSLDLDENFGL